MVKNMQKRCRIVNFPYTVFTRKNCVEFIRESSCFFERTTFGRHAWLACAHLCLDLSKVGPLHAGLIPWYTSRPSCLLSIDMYMHLLHFLQTGCAKRNFKISKQKKEDASVHKKNLQNIFVAVFSAIS